jgi:hypothetical protein
MSSDNGVTWEDKAEGVREPILVKNKYKWLIVKKKRVFLDEGRPIKEILKEGDSLKNEIFETVYEIQDEGRWQCKKCGCVLVSNPGKPEVCDEKQGGCGRASNFENLTPIINPDIWAIPKWKQIPNEDNNMLELYDKLMDVTKRCVVFPFDIQYKIFVLWTIATHKRQCWDAVPFLAFRGLISSGKTRALDLLREIGYRMVQSANVTFPALVRVSHFHDCGILLDEADSNLNSYTEVGQQYLKFLKTSYRRGSRYVVADAEDQQAVISYRNFGFKAFGLEKTMDEAMISRSILFDMEQDTPEVMRLDDIRDELEDIKVRLLNYKYGFNDPLPLPDEFPLKGRSRELFECLIRAGRHIGVTTDDVLQYAQEVEREKVEMFRDTIEWDILTIIKNYEQKETLLDAPEEIAIEEIRDALGWDNDSKSNQKVGNILKKKLQLKTKHKRSGSVLLLTHPKNERRLHYLYRRYGV